MAGVSKALKLSCDTILEPVEGRSSAKEAIIEEIPESAMRDDGSGVGDKVQDQVILAPEIMQMILEHLDLRGLKKARLVCKSWLIEAQIHVERRGIVCLSTRSKSTCIQEFIDMRRTKVAALPQPFKSIEVVLSLEEQGLLHPRADLFANQLSSLCPPLSITKFHPTRVPLDLAFTLILQCSTSLEDLKLHAITCEPGYLPPMDPAHNFPELECLEVEASVQEGGVSATGNHFPSIVAWIAKSSPNLENFYCESVRWNEDTLDMVSQLVLKVDVKDVDTLKLDIQNLSDAASEHFKSIPFTQLHDLRLVIYDSPEITTASLMATVPKVATTLEVLDLYGIREIPEDFPICPNVKHIFLFHLNLWSDRSSTHFPSLQLLTVHYLDVPKRGETWEYNTPLRHLKELIVWADLPTCSCCYGPEEVLDPPTLSQEDFGFSHSQTVKFFDTFPDLERLEISDTFVLHCCRLRAGGDPRFSNLMQGVKDLKMSRPCKCWKGVSHASDYSSLAVLTELESIEVESSEAVLSIPVQEMSGLKVLRFAWDDGWRDVDQLLEIASGVEKVIITNCCSVPRVLKSAMSKGLLMQFFELASNAECGCG